MRKLTVATGILGILLSALIGDGFAQEPFRYNYISASYSCNSGDKSHKIVVFSDVFAFCVAEFGGMDIAKMHKDNFDQAARLHCSGSVKGPYFDTSDFGNTKPVMESKRTKEMVEQSSAGATVEQIAVSVPYSSKCRP